MGKMITFERQDGGSCGGYLSVPDPPPLIDRRGAVVVIQEWWGLNDQICGVVDRFARAGFIALAPDLFGGRVAKDADEASHLMNGLDFPGATHQDIRGAVTYLQRQIGSDSQPGKVGVMGYCMGGALTIAAAVHVPGVSAACCLYGIPPKEFADPAQIRIPFQGHFANRDSWCTPDAANALEASMLAAGARPEIHRYDADHAFCNETRGDVYDADCANTAWERVKAFLTHNLLRNG